MKIAVVFPGIGYHVDKPLLYYSKKIAASHGYEIKNVPYGNFPSGVKGNKKRMNACFTDALDQEVGKRIARGERIEITPAHLRPAGRGGQYYGQARNRYKRCNYCGFETTEDFEYCPKCGRRFHM